MPRKTRKSTSLVPVQAQGQYIEDGTALIGWKSWEWFRFSSFSRSYPVLLWIQGKPWFLGVVFQDLEGQLCRNVCELRNQGTLHIPMHRGLPACPMISHRSPYYKQQFKYLLYGHYESARLCSFSLMSKFLAPNLVNFDFVRI